MQYNTEYSDLMSNREWHILVRNASSHVDTCLADVEDA
jgi:hypothetical protein